MSKLLPTKNNQPPKNPTVGSNILLTHTYTPPDLGIAADVIASNAQMGKNIRSPMAKPKGILAPGYSEAVDTE